MCISLLLVYTKSQAQDKDSLFIIQKNEQPFTGVEINNGLYFQEGNNSAVTGGIGTERLQVYSNSFQLKHQFRNRNTIHWTAGIDVITSESTDNIDFDVSSESSKDAHGYTNIAFSTKFDKSETYFSFGSGVSLESDYFSIPISIALTHQNRDRTRNWFIGIESYFDDLRWGRLDIDYKRPAFLIYPEELRTQEWFDQFWRYTNKLSFSFEQVVDTRSVFGLSGIIDYQRGLLSTPFHRVYFTDETVAVERLPNQRVRFPLAFQYNRFIGATSILKSTIGISLDNFGIISESLELEWVTIIDPSFAIRIFGRVYNQSGSKYFAAFGEHKPEAEFYTSDYDLSSMSSFKIGAGMKWSLNSDPAKKWTFDKIEFRYAFYKRSNQLSAHILSFQFDIGKKSSKRIKK